MEPATAPAKKAPPSTCAAGCSSPVAVPLERCEACGAVLGFCAECLRDFPDFPEVEGFSDYRAHWRTFHEACGKARIS